MDEQGAVVGVFAGGEEFGELCSCEGNLLPQEFPYVRSMHLCAGCHGCDFVAKASANDCLESGCEVHEAILHEINFYSCGFKCIW